MKRIALAAVVMVLAASCSRAATPPHARVAVCRSSNLVLTYPSPVIYLHHFVFVYGLRNSGPTACSMTGYPAVTARNQSGAPLGIHVEHLPEWDQVVAVTLRPGQTAGFFLASGSMPKVCGRRSDIYGTFEVAPPGASQTLAIATPARGACPGQVVFVSPVESGTAPPTSA